MPEVKTSNTFGFENAKISLEIALIYIMTGLVALTFFDSIKVALYSMLGYLALGAFLLVTLAMVSYTVYNFGKGLFLLLSR